MHASTPDSNEALTKRHLYQTGIGPVCMSEAEHAAYLEAREEQELRKELEDHEEN